MSKKLDFGRLLGFETLKDSSLSRVDFQDETVSAKLGAKMSIEPTQPARRSRDETPRRAPDRRTGTKAA